MTDWTPTLAPGGRARYQQIADAIEADLHGGRLKPGDRLPPQRKLAERLGIDFTTVSRAYAEAHARELIESHVGRGTFIRARTVAPQADDRQRSPDLSMNMPPDVTDPDLLARMREGLAAVSSALVPLLRYQATTGSDQDKATATRWLARRGFDVASERLAITPGAHAAMVAILSVIARPGDRLLCERETYPGLRAIAAQLGLVLVGVEMDAAGIIPAQLEAAIREHAPAALYLNPTLHNPTTLTMPEARRREITAILAATNLPLIEDDAYGFVPKAPPPPLALLAPAQGWHIAGLSKSIGAGLRLAYVVAPDARAAVALARALRTSVVMPSPICIALATAWIESGTADRILDFVRRECAARQKIAASVLGGATFSAQPEAYNIWLSLPEGASRAELMGRMAGRHIGMMPADAFTVDGAPAERIRICLGGPISREDLRAGLMFLGNSLSGGGWMG